MTKPSSKVQEVLATALSRVVKSPKLSPEDVQWVKQFALRTIAEFSVVKSQKDETDARERTIAA